MKHCKTVIGGYICSIGTSESGNITEEEYNTILEIINSAPKAPEGFTYKLKDNSFEWELSEITPQPEPEEEATEQDYRDSLNRLGVDV